MIRKEVSSSGVVTATADQVWSVVCDFHCSWHPIIASMEKQFDAAGRQIRAFTVHGESTTYLEQLTWFSYSDKSYAYRHVEGIQGVARYKASLKVTAEGGNAVVTLQAGIIAPPKRAAQVAQGTQIIFDQAIAAIQAASQSAVQSIINGAGVGTGSTADSVTIHNKMVQGDLAISTVNGPADADSTLCLFLHGIGGNRHNWQRQLLGVAPLCKAAALDLRGYGDSSAGSHQTTVEDYCEDILRVTKAFNADKLILCGLSYGAWIATSFAMRHSKLLSALVLGGGCTGMSEASAEQCQAFRDAREAPLREGKTPADLANDVINVLAGPDISDSVKAELHQSMGAISATTYTDAIRCFTNPQEQFDLSKITMPVLLMTGDADKLAPPQEIHQVAQRIVKISPTPDVRFECLPRTGHVCNLESPDAFNTPLLELVQRVCS